jgi:hypothetical protein
MVTPCNATTVGDDVSPSAKQDTITTTQMTRIRQKSAIFKITFNP